MILGIRHLFYASRVYGFLLRGKAPASLLGTVPDLWPGDAAVGAGLVEGNFSAGGQQFQLNNLGHEPGGAGEAWLEALHGFGWLGHLRAQGGDQAKRRAIDFVQSWAQANGNWRALSWRPDILGERLANLLIHFAFLTSGAEEAFKQALLASLGHQARHLARTAGRDTVGGARLAALRGLIHAGCCLPDGERNLNRGLADLEVETISQILPDGGHYARSPTQQARILKLYVEVRETLVAAHREIPDWLTVVISRMAIMLRALRHGDGGLALFNGSTEEGGALLDAILAKAAVRGRALSAAPHAGFYRLAAGRTLLLMEAGAPPGAGQNRWAHAGTLSFELSSGKERLIVNCGASTGDDPHWRHALRTTAAHSTLVVDDINSSQILDGGGFSQGAVNVTASRREIDGSVIVETSHDGYEEILGLIHRRLIMLASDGAEVRGEDNLIGTGGESYALRFHLHPGVKANLLSDGKSVLMKLPRGGGWRLQSADGSLAVEESVYFGDGVARRKSLQIVLTGSLEGAGATFKWQINRVEK